MQRVLAPKTLAKISAVTRRGRTCATPAGERRERERQPRQAARRRRNLHPNVAALWTNSQWTKRRSQAMSSKSTREFVVIKEIRCADKAARDEARRTELLRKHSHPVKLSASDEQTEALLSRALRRRRSEPIRRSERMLTLVLRHVHARACETHRPPRREGGQRLSDEERYRQIGGL